MYLEVGIYDSHILLRTPPDLAPNLSLLRRILSHYPCKCQRRMCLFPSHRNEFLPTVGVIHLRPEDPWRVASFFGRALRNYYGPKAENFALFHAGSVSDGREAILFLGHHAWGKSTLVRGFLREGYRYLSDDMVAFGIGDGLVYPTLPVEHRLRFGEVSNPVPIGTVFLSRYVPEGETVIEEVEPYEAYLFAMENLLNPGAVGRNALSLLLTSLSSARTYRTLHSDWRDVLRFYSSRSR